MIRSIEATDFPDRVFVVITDDRKLPAVCPQRGRKAAARSHGCAFSIQQGGLTSRCDVVQPLNGSSIAQPAG